MKRWGAPTFEQRFNLFSVLIFELFHRTSVFFPTILSCTRLTNTSITKLLTACPGSGNRQQMLTSLTINKRQLLHHLV